MTFRVRWASFACIAIIKGEARFCGKVATWFAEYSDRRWRVCDEHRDEVRQSRDNDYDYDKTGILWESSDGRIEYEPYHH